MKALLSNIHLVRFKEKRGKKTLVHVHEFESHPSNEGSLPATQNVSSNTTQTQQKRKAQRREREEERKTLFFFFLNLQVHVLIGRLENAFVFHFPLVVWLQKSLRKKKKKKKKN